MKVRASVKKISPDDIYVRRKGVLRVINKKKPDAIHSDLKDQVILKAGQTFTSKTRYELVVK